MIDRRRFLQVAAGAALGVGAAGAGGLLWRRRSRAHAPPIEDIGPEDHRWGEYPREARSSRLPEEQRAHSVLDIFLAGGICPWETFYVVDEPDYGKADNEMWWTFHDGPESIEETCKKCLVPTSSYKPKDFVRDRNGVMVKLGPFVDALRQREDITDRLRLLVMSHHLRVHELAIPLAMTGYRLAFPRFAGLGAPVQHYFLPRAEAREPAAWVLAPYDRQTSFFTALLESSGAHPSFTRPLMLHLDSDARFADALERRSVGEDREASDRLLDSAVASFRARLVRDGAPVRSRVWEEYDYAVSALRRADAIAGAFDRRFLAPIHGEACGLQSARSLPAMQLRLAAHLLGRPDSPTRYVGIFETGLFTDLNDPTAYDTHRRHIYDMGRNLPYFMEQLCAVINRPGEKDPNKIDLDRTLVVINTEFGRSPGTQGMNPREVNPKGGTGRNHHAEAYVAAMFGGPIGPKQKGIVGAIDRKAHAVDPLAPAESRAAVLAALGIWPFSGEGYSVSDMRDVKTTAEAAARVKEKVLGIG
jgi:hypothetical protein